MADRLPPAAPLPADTIALHIGVHKTGTTALQAALADARPELKAHGVLYPGRRKAHHGAATAILARESSWAGQVQPPPDPRVFERVARTARRHRGRVVISSEGFCEADDQVAEHIVTALGRDRTHVVVALRRLSDLLYSSWQQYLKAGRTRPYDKWLTAILDPDYDGSVTPSFWRRNDHGAVVQRWARLLGPRNVTVLILEDVSQEALFVSFAELLGLPPATLTARMPPSSNRSMTAAEAELVRRLNRAVRGALDGPTYEDLIRNGVIPAITNGRSPAVDEARLPTPDWALDAAAERAAGHVAMIRACGATVLGDVDALAVRGVAAAPVDMSTLDQVPTAAVVEVLASAVRARAAIGRRGDPLEPVRAVRNKLARRIPYL
jgi:hypothetical protein